MEKSENLGFDFTREEASKIISEIIKEAEESAMNPHHIDSFVRGWLTGTLKSILTGESKPKNFEKYL